MYKYNKAFVAVLAVILNGLNALYGNDPRVAVVISVAGALGVYAVPNRGNLKS